MREQSLIIEIRFQSVKVILLSKPATLKGFDSVPEVVPLHVSNNGCPQLSDFKPGCRNPETTLHYPSRKSEEAGY
ncbi:hypothetical protein E2C01_021755 [Portunus trituberculatus]|uniref:Uncharacterized protein n=1 Tax=Portunus trituberculatus TaxID=210409 RepID=A0A5B7E5F5_PORTR|nr:hypothetical protein [Portunus trituberculatus]